MLSSIIDILQIAVLSGLLFLEGLVYGKLKEIESTSKSTSLKTIKKPRKVFTKRIQREIEKKGNEQIRRMQGIFENLERYDGTSIGQKEIK